MTMICGIRLKRDKYLYLFLWIYFSVSSLNCNSNYSTYIYYFEFMNNIKTCYYFVPLVPSFLALGPRRYRAFCPVGKTVNMFYV